MPSCFGYLHWQYDEHGGTVVGLLNDVPARTLIWIIALAMIIPVLALGSGIVSSGLYAWLALAVLIILGSKLIWWATERAWGKFS
jgi:hypothetical protein